MGALDAVKHFATGHVAAAVIGKDGVRQEFGERNLPFRLASVTKLFSAYAALVACEERTVELDDEAGPPGATVAHLLAHASGLSRDRAERVVTRPGVRRIYSNAGFAVMAGHVASRARVAFGDYVREAVFEPLLMKSASLTGSPAFGAAASLADCEAFAGELLAPRLLDESTFASATTVAFPGLEGILPGFGRQDPCGWGLGFELRDAKRPHWTGSANSSRTFGHFGQSGTFIWVDPERVLALVVLTDREFGDWAKKAWPELSDAVLAETDGG